MLIGLPLNGDLLGVILIWPLMTFTNNMIIKHEEAYLRQEFKISTPLLFPCQTVAVILKKQAGICRNEKCTMKPSE